MSLDDTARSIWQTAKPPLGLLVAGCATEMLAAPLPEPVRATFAALSRGLVGWWPKRQRMPRDIHENEFQACLAAAEAHGAEAQPAMIGARMQLAAMLELVPRSLPAEFEALGEDDFVKLLRQTAKVGRLPLAQLEARLTLLVERKQEPWPQLVARAARMRWERSEAWGDLDARVRDLAAFADLGAVGTWSKIGAQDVLHLQLDGTKRMAVLRPEELAALRAVIPAIPEPG